MSETDVKLNGVKGWLLLLCLTLTVLDPSAVLFNLFYITSSARPHFDRNPELFRLILVSGVCRIALMVFSMYAGLSLWKRLPGAPVVAIRYFRAVVLYSVFVLFLPLLVGVPEDTYREMSGVNSANSMVTVLYVALWYLYMKKSKRVKATYGSNP